MNVIKNPLQEKEESTPKIAIFFLEHIIIDN